MCLQFGWANENLYLTPTTSAKSDKFMLEVSRTYLFANPVREIEAQFVTDPKLHQTGAQTLEL